MDEYGADHQEILELVGIAVLTIDASGILQDVNTAAIEMFGYSREQLLGNNISLLMPEPHSEKHDSYLRRHIATGETNIIGVGRKVEGLRSDGTVFPLHLAVGRFERSGDPFFTGIIHDLTDQEHAHEAVARFGRIIDESTNEIYIFNVSSLVFTMVNRGARANLGYTLEELQQMTPLDIKPLLDRTAFLALIKPLLNGEQDQVQIQTVHQRKDKTRYDVDVVLHLSDAVSPPEVVAIVQDSTERNQLTSSIHQAQKMEAIGQLTGGIAHDFNNFLTVISGNLELLDMLTGDAKSKELISEARAASALGAKLTSQLLSFASKSSLMAEPVNLNNTIINISDLLRRSLGEEVVLHTVLSPELWTVKIDETLFNSALINLAINAKDAIAGSGSFSIDTSNHKIEQVEALSFGLAAGDYVRMMAIDTGIGIEKEHLSAIFEPFFTTKRKSTSNGIGLGLSMVYGFVSQSGGKLMVHSEPPNGTIFTIFFPRSLEEIPTIIPVNGKYSLAASKTKPILVVEDDVRVRKITVQRLEHMGYQTLEASDGRQAMELYAINPDISLLFTDMIMPNDLTGYDLAQKIRQIDPNIAVIIASGYSNELALLGQLPEERMVLLRKPYELHVLAEALESALSQL